MATIEYPSTLPCPTQAPLTPVERRLVSQLDGARITDVRQRDRLASQSVAFVFSFAEMAAFNAWWKETLVYGGSWFAADWALPQGGTGVRKFVGAPRRDLIAGYGWRVSALCEVRGVGELPTDCFDESFDDLTEYATVTGNRGVFTLGSSTYGAQMQIASQNTGTAARIRKAINARQAVTLSAKFKMTSLQADDAALLSLFNSGSQVLAFNPRREAAIDSSRRAVIQIGAEALQATAASLLVDTWYQVDVTIATGAGNTVCRILKISDGSTVQTTTLVSSHTPPDIDAIDFSADSGGATSATVYADLHVCS